MRIIANNGLVYDSADYSYYLAHHEIQGQKWGKKNGPPYPLAPSAHSQAEKRLRLVNDGQLDSWKDEQSYKTNKRYDKRINRLEKKINKSTHDLMETSRKPNASDKAVAKKQAKIQKLVEKSIKTEAMKALENEALAKMNIDDVNAEEIKVIKARAKDALLTIGSMALHAGGIIPFHFYAISNTKSIRRDSRMNTLNIKQKQGLSDLRSNKNVAFVANRAKGMRTSGLSYAQIARKLGIPLSSVSYYLNL